MTRVQNQSTQHSNNVGSGRRGKCIGCSCLGELAERPPLRNSTSKIAGYDYDRVRAIMDGHAGMEGAEVTFHVEDIYLEGPVEECR